MGHFYFQSNTITRSVPVPRGLDGLYVGRNNAPGFLFPVKGGDNERLG